METPSAVTIAPGLREAAGSTKRYTPFSLKPGANGCWLVTLEDGEHASQSFADKHVALTSAKGWAAANRPSKLQIVGTTGHVEQEWTFA